MKVTYEGGNLENWTKERLVQELRTRVSVEAQLIQCKDALDLMLRAFDPNHPGACRQECFDSSDGCGYQVQEMAKEKAKEVLGLDQKVKVVLVEADRPE